MTHSPYGTVSCFYSLYILHWQRCQLNCYNLCSHENILDKKKPKLIFMQGNGHKRNKVLIIICKVNCLRLQGSRPWFLIAVIHSIYGTMNILLLLFSLNSPLAQCQIYCENLCSNQISFVATIHSNKYLCNTMDINIVR